MTLFQRIKLKTSGAAVVVITAAILSGFGLFTLVSNIFDRSPPIDYLAASASAVSVPQGGTIDIHFDVYRFRICSVIKVSRVLTDSQNEKHAVSNYTFSTNTRPGHESYDRTITIPEDVALGRSFYQLITDYACNFIHQLGWPIVVSSPRVYFRITPETNVIKIQPIYPPPERKDGN